MSMFLVNTVLIDLSCLGFDIPPRLSLTQLHGFNSSDEVNSTGPGPWDNPLICITVLTVSKLGKCVKHLFRLKKMYT